MRLHPLWIVFSVPALFIACSAGGPGSTSTADPAVFGQSGPTIAPLGPGAPTGGGGQTTNPPRDTGVVLEDTGGGTDTNVAVDTGMSGNPVCSRPSKCSDTFIPATTCNDAISRCGAPATTFFTCLSNNQVCATDGTTDQAATIGACSAEGEAYNAACGT